MRITCKMTRIGLELWGLSQGPMAVDITNKQRCSALVRRASMLHVYVFLEIESVPVRSVWI